MLPTYCSPPPCTTLITILATAPVALSCGRRRLGVGLGIARSPSPSHLSPSHLSPLTPHLSPLTPHPSPLTPLTPPLTRCVVVAVRRAVLSPLVSPSAAARFGGVSPGCALLRSLWRLLCSPWSPKQSCGGAAGEVDGAAGGAAGTPHPSCRDPSAALRRSGQRGAAAMAWQSYRQPSLTPRSTFDVDSDQGGGRLRSMSMSQLQHSRHGLGHGVLERASDEESVAGGSPLVQVYSTV